MILLLLLNMFFASTFTLGKAALAYVQPIFFIGVRMVVAGTLLLLYQCFFNKQHFKVYKKHVLFFLAIMLVHIYIPFVCEFWSLQYISSSKTSLLYSLTPFIMALFAYFTFHETITRKKWWGLAIGFAGFLPILLAQDVAENGISHLFFLSTAEMVLLIAIASSTAGWLFMKKLIQENYSPVMINGVGMLGGGLLALFTSLLVEQDPLVPTVPQETGAVAGKFEQFLLQFMTYEQVDFALFLFYMTALILIANILCYNLYGYLLRRHSATLISFSGLTIPLFGALFGWFFLGEHIPWQFFVSMVIVCCGLYIFYQEDLRLKKLEKLL
jgi:drug/metabolite transporter (DMT)-like permease